MCSGRALSPDRLNEHSGYWVAFGEAGIMRGSGLIKKISCIAN